VPAVTFGLEFVLPLIGVGLDLFDFLSPFVLNILDLSLVLLHELFLGVMSLITKFVDNGLYLPVSFTDHFFSDSLLEIRLLFIQFLLVLLDPLFLRDLLFFLESFDFSDMLSILLLDSFLVFDLLIVNFFF